MSAPTAFCKFSDLGIESEGEEDVDLFLDAAGGHPNDLLKPGLTRKT